MRICMMTNTYLPHVGGVARSVSSFTAELERQGHDLLVVCPSFPDATQDEGNILRVPAVQNFNGSDFSVRLGIPARVADRLEVFAPDVVHSHHPFLMGDTGLRAARRNQCPLVFTHHTRWERYTHYVGNDSEIMQRLAKQLGTAYANLCDCVIAPSTSVRDLLRKRGVRQRIEVVPTGVDDRFFHEGDDGRGRERWALGEESFVVGHVGRLAKEKNLPYLVAAVAPVLQDDPASRFLVVGKGAAEGDVERLADRVHSPGRVVRTGKLAGTELCDAYRAMDVFVFSSQSETQGLVLLEAMAGGTPVVALDGPGVRDVVEDGVNGRLLPASASAEEFADAVRALRDDAEFAKRCRDGAFETASRLSLSRQTAALADLYASVTAWPPPQRRQDDVDLLSGVVSRLRAEWELLSEKTSALSSSLFPKG